MPAVALSQEEAARAIASLIQLRANFPLWAERCYTILDKHEQYIPLKLNKVQQILNEEEDRQLRTRRESRIFVLKARQGGITTWKQAKNLHLAWSSPGARAITMAHDRDSMDKIFGITTRALDHFPKELLPKLGDKETREVSFPKMDSSFFTGTAGAGRTGRGLTIRAIHASEFAFWDKPRTTLNTMTPALNKAGNSILIETTASGADTPAHQFWLEIRDDPHHKYKAFFFPWWDIDPVEYRLPVADPDEVLPLEDEETDLQQRFNLDLEQIAWRRDMIKDMGRLEFLQEYAEDEETCWIAPGGMFYEADLLKHMLTIAPKPIRTELGGDLEIYAEWDGTSRVLIANDVAEGMDNDRTAWTARTLLGKLLARYASRRVTPEDNADILNAQKGRYHTPLITVEKNAHGITTLRRLRDVHRYPIEFLYHRTKYTQDRNTPTREIGWLTSPTTQPLLLDAFRELLEACKAGTYDPPPRDAIKDAFRVRRDEHGKIKLTGRDVLVSEAMNWLARSYPIFQPLALPPSVSQVTMGV